MRSSAAEGTANPAPSNSSTAKSNDKDEYDFSLVDINRMEFKAIDLELGLDNFAKLWLDDDSLNIIAKEYAKLVNINEEKSINILKNCDIKLKSFVEFKRKIRGKN